MGLLFPPRIQQQFASRIQEYNGLAFANGRQNISREASTLMSATPGGRGGQSVLGHLSSIIQYWGAKLVGPFSLPTFHENFGGDSMNAPLESELKEKIQN